MQNSEPIRNEILNLEKKYWNAMRNQDLDAALSLTDFPCLVAGAQGISSVNQEQFQKMFNSNQNSFRTFNFDEDKVEVRQVSPDTAVIAYRVQTTLTKDGQEKSIDAIDTSTWVKRNDKWVCAMHTEVELKPQ